MRTTGNWRPLAPKHTDLPPTRCLLHQSQPLAAGNPPTRPRGDRRDLSRPRVTGTSTRSNQQIISTSEKGPQHITPGTPSRIEQISRAGLQATLLGQHQETHQDAIIAGI